MNEVKKKRGLLGELKRLVPWLLIIAAAFVYCDPMGAQIETAVYRLSMLATIVIFLHIGRKMLFPYLDLEASVWKAFRSPIGAGLVWFGTMVFLSTFMYLAMVK